MKIVALYGRGECGKSETLGIYLRRFVRERAGLVSEDIWKDTRESIPLGNIVINICPPGDTKKIVLENIVFFEAHPFDVAFCATRSWGEGCNALEEYAARVGADLVWIKKPYNDNLDRKGQSAANELLAKDLIDRFL
jgi:hypothetical protein